MKGRQGADDAPQVLGFAGETYVQIVSHECTSVQYGRPAADNHELDAGIAQRLYNNVGIHSVRRRTAPCTRVAACDAANNRLTRSSGVNRNCSIRSVKSTPYAFAA